MEPFGSVRDIVYVKAVLRRGEKKESGMAAVRKLEDAIQKMQADTGLPPFTGDTPQNCLLAEIMRIGVVMKGGELTGAHETLLKHPDVFGSTKKWVEAYDQGKSTSAVLERMQGLVDKPTMTERSWKMTGKSAIETQRQQAANTARKAAKDTGLPNLKGTTKRKTWGEQIRSDFIKNNAGETERLLRLSKDEPRFVNAVFWIDNRFKNIPQIFNTYDLLIENVAKKSAEMQAAMQAEPIDPNNPRGISMNNPAFAIQNERNAIVRKIDALFESRGMSM